MASEYSLTDVLERIYQNQAAVMELTLRAEQRGVSDVGENVRGALDALGENTGHVKQGLTQLSGLNFL
ncbi:hypothetical protein [Pseudomonas lactucae]|uniref:hypothetical protein n=1 Tax=Pseudomonas lactucae TaxID=2813360 RepID=UPI001CED6847|nr:hypothetical protein [Pseudomonas lactucae]